MLSVVRAVVEVAFDGFLEVAETCLPRLDLLLAQSIEAGFAKAFTDVVFEAEINEARPAKTIER